MRLILASSSPYRHEMLTRLGIPFTAISPNIDETGHKDESPASLALRLSVDKAQAVAKQLPSGEQAVIIGSDQVATYNGMPIGKPGNFDRALIQLRQLSGQTVQFHSALCVSNGQRYETADIITHCVFRELSDHEIQCYLQRERPYDTAGSAKAEGLGIALMKSMQSSDPTAIIGLPLIALSDMLRSFGINPLTYTETP